MNVHLITTTTTTIIIVHFALRSIENGSEYLDTSLEWGIGCLPISQTCAFRKRPFTCISTMYIDRVHKDAFKLTTGSIPSQNISKGGNVSSC